MTVKDFAESGRVYTLKEKRGAERGFERGCLTVKSVGRKYVIAGGDKFYAPDWGRDYFVEKTNCSPQYKAFPTMQAADDYVEKENLRMWMRKATGWSKLETYSIEQLRAVKEILEKPQTVETQTEAGKLNA